MLIRTYLKKDNTIGMLNDCRGIRGKEVFHFLFICKRMELCRRCVPREHRVFWCSVPYVITKTNRIESLFLRRFRANIYISRKNYLDQRGEKGRDLPDGWRVPLLSSPNDNKHNQKGNHNQILVSVLKHINSFQTTKNKCQ